MNSTKSAHSNTVAIVGASNDTERYANKAQQLLMQKGFAVIPVSPKEQQVLGTTCVPDLTAIHAAVDTVTLYIAPAKQQATINEILRLKPRRVIFNPGTENPAVYQQLEDTGIEHEQACTLVLLKTGQF
jgi:predicted CoA-binding protein